MEFIEAEIIDFKNINTHNFKMDESKKEVYIDDRNLELTAKEFDVFNLLIKNPNQVLTRETLLKQVWGFNHYGESRAVDIEIRRLRQKIEPDPSNPKYILTKWGKGYYYKNYH